jgi:NADPH-dependent 2,4-dienoyl-CoA reductase/sulfur reductase-like enzyme
MTEAENVVIVGASLAGLRTAEALRDGGYTGRLTLIGDEPHAPYDRPPLSKQVLKGWVSPLETTLPRLRSIGATWHLGTAATRLDRKSRRVETANNEAVTFDRLVVATGARARAWPDPAQAALRGVHTLRTPEDATALVADLDAGPARVLIIGAGFTGSEVASACRDRGLAVTVVELNNAPLVTAVGTLIGDYIAKRQREATVDLRCGVSATSLLSDMAGRVVGARLSDGDQVAADVVVICLGAVRNFEWLEGAGLDAGPAGCVCNSSCNALEKAGLPVPDIFVCGDIARLRHPLSGGRLVSLDHWSAATEQAKVVAANLLRAGSATNDTNLPRFWSAQFGVGLKASGLPACADELMIVQGSAENGRFIVGYGREGRIVGVVAVNQARWLAFYERQIITGGAFPPDYRVVDQPTDTAPRPARFPLPPTPHLPQAAECSVLS